MPEKNEEELKDPRTCDCEACRIKRGELKYTLSELRHKAVSEFRKKINEALKTYKHGVDGWAFALVTIEDSKKAGLQNRRHAAVNSNSMSIDCVAHLMAHAILDLKGQIGCSREDAFKILEGKAIDLLNQTIGAQERRNPLMDLMRAFPLRDLMRGPEEEPEKSKAAPEPAPANVS